MAEIDKVLDADLFSEEENSVAYQRNLKHLKQIKKKINRAGNFLFAIGILTLFNKFTPYFIHSIFLGMFFYVAVGAFYIAMGVLSNYKPVIGIGIALTVYTGMSLSLVAYGSIFAIAILLVRLVVCIILSFGLYNASKFERLKDEYGIYKV